MTLNLFVYFLRSLAWKHQVYVGLVTILSLIISLDVLFNHLLLDLSDLNQLSLQFFIGFAPEIWISVLALVLGTLIIVISVASQNTPRLIDLYLQNWRSIMFMWYLIMGGIHSIFVVFFEEELHRPSSEILNSFLLLPIAIIISLPYVYYALSSSKVDNVILAISRQALNSINRLPELSRNALFSRPNIVAQQQQILLEKINNLDHLFHYVVYKEFQISIVSNLSEIMERFQEIKLKIENNFFYSSEVIRSDISFRNYNDFRYNKMEKYRIFLEEKILIMFSEFYLYFLQKGNFDLASDTISKIINLGKISLEKDDSPTLGLVTLRLNTLMRYTLNHGLKHKSSRGMTNLIFQNTKLLSALISLKKKNELERFLEFSQIYGKELFKACLNHKSLEPAFLYFLFESKHALIQLNEEGWDKDVQIYLLNGLFALFEHPADEKRLKDIEAKSRLIFLGMTLYYVGEQNETIISSIIKHIKKQLKLSPLAFKKELMESLEELGNIPRTYWEDSDHGNRNYLFSNDSDLIPDLGKLIEESD